MLSTRLVHRIEDHAEQIATSILERVRSEPNLAGYHSLSERDFHDRVWDVCKHLGDWLTDRPEGRIRERYEALGQQRHDEDIPLHEVVLALTITKEEILAYLQSDGWSGSTLDLYAKEELELQVARFFDRCVYYVVRGYEETLRGEVRHSTYHGAAAPHASAR